MTYFMYDMFCTQGGKSLQALHDLSARDGQVCDSGRTKGTWESGGDGHIPHQGRSTSSSLVWLIEFGHTHNLIM